MNDETRALLRGLRGSAQAGADPRAVIGAGLLAAVDAAHAEAGTFWFYRRFEDGRICPMAVCGGAKLDDIYLLPGEGIAGRVIDKCEPIMIGDCRKDARWIGKVDAETGFVTRSMLCVPLVTSGMAFAAMQIINKKDEGAFGREDLEAAEALAGGMSRILKKTELLRDYRSQTAAELGLARENAVRREIISQISTYMDPAIMREILRRDGKHKKGLETEEIAVLFADIRGFTRLAEKLTSAQLITSLSDFLALTSRCIHERGGVVDKFMGDCTMGYWRVNEDPGAAADACGAALEIQKEARAFAAHMKRQTGLEIGIGIGVHAGPALLCHIGGERYMAYTAIGDVVNTASRLEDNAPAGSIYVSREVMNRLGGAARACRLENGVVLRGKQDPFEVWILNGLA